MLTKQLSALLDMDSGVALNKALKKYLIETHKKAIYLSLAPQMGGFIDENSISLSVLQSENMDANFLLKCSVFYEEKIGGCNCNDEPYSENGYCELNVKLNKNEFVIL